MKKAPTQVSGRGRTAGFTLLELMIAITVLTIGISIAVPSFNDMTRRHRLTTQTNSLMSALAIARSEAVKRGTPVTVCPVAANNPDDCSTNSNWAATGWLILSDVRTPLGRFNVDATAEPNTNDQILQRVAPASEQKIRVVNAEVSSLTYRPDGMVQLPAGTRTTTFVLSPEVCRNPDGSRRVEVIAAGRVSFKKAACPT
ncbi:GspH/FimT family pseudopilin [Steroidobacter flavus]|uniref:Type II secretion system protein H n=1 Tax=Steroidobacter flavus TaxID=1842136 RepID=A0ABV8SXA7_9GAMM